MSRFLSKEYQSLEPYTPGEQPQQKKLIKLNTNESPYPPSPFVYRSIDQFEIDNLRLYSDPEAKQLVKAIAETYHVDASNIIVGNGSDELLAFSFMAFQNNQKKVYYPSISYGFYPVYATVYGMEKCEIPLDENLRVNPKDYYNLDGTIIIANPNAPTGIALTVDEIEAIVISNPNNLVLIDEAYVDFGAESCLSLIHKYDNLLVVQTFSKSRNLAGARIGFAVGNPEIISDLNRIKFSFNPYNINRLSILAGVAAMQDKDYFRKCTTDIIRTRTNFVKEMELLNFEILPSKANFVFARHKQLSGKDYFTALREKNILVRYFDKDPIKAYVRITIGAPDEMAALLKASKDILGIEENIE